MATRKRNDIKQLTGSKHARKEPAKLAPVSVEQPPRGWLTPAARTIYKRLAPSLRSSGMLRDQDVLLLCQLCESAAIAMESRKEMVETGVIVPGSISVKKSPSFQIWRDSVSMLEKLSRQFGNSPRSAQQLDPVAGPTNDVMSELFSMVARDGNED